MNFLAVECLQRFEFCGKFRGDVNIQGRIGRFERNRVPHGIDIDFWFWFDF